MLLQEYFILSGISPILEKYFQKQRIFHRPSESRGFDSSGIITNLFVLGFTSTSVQILLMREIMNISGGYELITGLFLGSWLIASAGGSSSGHQISSERYSKDQHLIFSVSPLISLVLLIILSRLFLETGEIPSFLVHFNPSHS